MTFHRYFQALRAFSIPTTTMKSPFEDEYVAWLQGKLAWLEYLERWLTEDSTHAWNPVDAAWEDFQREHPDIANGPGFVTRT